MTKSRNWELIRVTSSNERLKHKCVDLSNQCIFLTQFGTEHKYHLGFRKNVNNSRLDKDICIKFYGIMHWTLAYTTACTTVFTACTVVQAVLTVCTVVSCSNNFSTKLDSGCWATGAPKKFCGPRTPYHVLRTLNSVTATEMCYRNVIKVHKCKKTAV